MLRSLRLPSLLLFALLSFARPAWATFELNISIGTPGAFTATQLQELQHAVNYSKNLWEGVITGYQPGINLTGITVVVESGSTFADASVTGSVHQAGFQLSTSGRVRVNPAVIDIFASWDGSGPANPNPDFIGLNYLEDIMAHEVGHVLGFGIHWVSNGVYVHGSGQYTGQYGLAAYQQEFDATATFVPVELAGSAGTQNSHWDQIMRSSPQEGDPNDPWSLSPLTGITDQFGRDLALELMTGALDPDYGRNFLSRTTIQSLRDLGFTVVPEPGSLVLVSLVLVVAAGHRTGRFSGR